MFLVKTLELMSCMSVHYECLQLVFLRVTKLLLIFGSLSKVKVHTYLFIRISCICADMEVSRIACENYL